MHAKILKTRTYLRTQLGDGVFEKVYSFLVVARLQDQTGLKQQLQQMVGQSPQRLRLCFEIDQLIYYEELFGLK